MKLKYHITIVLLLLYNYNIGIVNEVILHDIVVIVILFQYYFKFSIVLLK